MLNVTKYVDAPESFVERTLARYEVDEDHGCWLYTGSTTRDGYAQANVKIAGRQWSIYPHVLAYLAHNGELVEGLQIDHQCHDPAMCIEPCRHRRCINPAHLVQMPGRDNLMRSGSPIAANARRTHCPQGHSYDSAEKNGNRRCSECRRRDRRNGYARTGAAANAKRAERMRSDPEYREKRLAPQRAYASSEAAKLARRERYRTDPAYREQILKAVKARYEAKKRGDAQWSQVEQ